MALLKNLPMDMISGDLYDALDLMIQAAYRGARAIQRDFHELSVIRRPRKEISDFIRITENRSYRSIMEILENTNIATTALVEDYGIVPMLNAAKSNRLSLMDYQFIIDPLDGTSNFMHANSNYAISIALHKIPKKRRNAINDANIANDSKANLIIDNVIAGVVYIPSTNEMFVASQGNGAYIIDRNGERRRIYASGEDSLEMSLIGISMRYKESDMHYSSLLAKLKDNRAKMRISGAISMDCALLASGRLSAICLRELCSWDCAAGILIAKEAGSIVCDLYYDELNSLENGVICGNKKLIEEIKRVMVI